jgi:hypothetical protein
MNVVFLTPLAALVGLAALAPLGLAVLRERRDDRLRRAVGAAAPAAWTRFASAAAAAVVVACLAAAAAQPALRSERVRRVRGDAQMMFVLDISRSMLARARPAAPTRFERAQALAGQLRRAFPDVPAGIASLTDWLLPHAFPTVSGHVFERTLLRAIGIERPRPSVTQRNATDFGGLSALAAGNYFSPGARHRLAIVLSDGESRAFARAPLAAALRRAGIRLLIVRTWSPTEAIYVGKRRDPGYAPNPLARAPLEALAASTGGGRVFGEGERGAIVAKARALLGSGPELRAARTDSTMPLAPYAVLAAVLPFGFVLLRR